MASILSFIETIGEIIFAAVEFLISMVQDLIYVIGLLASMLAQIPNMIAWLPSACITLTLTAFGIVVIYKVLGREG